MQLKKLQSLVLIVIAAALTPSARGAITYTGGQYSQDFNSLGTSGTLGWANDSTLPGWSLFRRPANSPAPITSITGGTGSSNAGAFYSFGSDGDRALGGLGSGGTYFGSPGTNTVAGWMAVSFSNATADTIDNVSVEFDGEQWRNGGNASPQTMIFEYGFGSSFADVVTWTAPGGTFDFVSPIATTSAGALDGNASENRTVDLGGDLLGIGWTSGSTLWMRWIEHNDAGNDHGLAVDDFSFSAQTVVEPVENADFDGDGDVDGRDFLIWQQGYGSVGTPAPLELGNANNDNIVDGLDLEIWQNQYLAGPMVATGTVPEPSSLAIASVVIALAASSRKAKNIVQV